MSADESTGARQSHRFNFTSVMFGFGGVAVTALGLYATVERIAGVPWPVSPNGLMHFLSYHYQTLREALTYWWLPILARWLGIHIPDWVKDVPVILGGVGLGLSAASSVMKDAEFMQPILRLLSAVPRVAQPFVLFVTAVGGALTYLLLTGVVAAIFATIAAAVPTFAGAGGNITTQAYGIGGAIGILFGYELFELFVPRVSGLDKYVLGCAFLAAFALLYSIVLLGTLVATDILGAALRLWPPP